MPRINYKAGEGAFFAAEEALAVPIKDFTPEEIPEGLSNQVREGLMRYSKRRGNVSMVPGQPAITPPPIRNDDEKVNYARMMRESIRPDDWKDVIMKALEQAKRGNRYARAWLSDYLLGKPIQLIAMQSDQQMKVTVEYVKAPEREQIVEGSGYDARPEDDQAAGAAPEAKENQG